MNKKDKIKQIRYNYNHYHLPGCSNLHRVKKNAIFINNHNTISHELSKCLGAIMLHKYGDVIFNKNIITTLNILGEEVKRACRDFSKNSTDFLTECTPSDDRDRRIDLVNLFTNDHYEFENKKTEKKKGAITIYLR